MSHSQNRRLCTRKYKRRPIQLPFKTLLPMEGERNSYDCQRQKEIGYWYLGPRDIPYQALSWLTVANDEFLSSWTVHIGQDHNSLWSATLRRHVAHQRLCPLAQEANWMAETREWQKRKLRGMETQLPKRHGPHGTVPCHYTVTWDFGLGKSTKHIANHCQFPCRAPKCLVGLDLGNARNTAHTWDSALM